MAWGLVGQRVGYNKGSTPDRFAEGPALRVPAMDGGVTLVYGSFSMMHYIM